jgi:hypothetical protein
MGSTAGEIVGRGNIFWSRRHTIVREKRLNHEAASQLTVKGPHVSSFFNREAP